MNLINNKYQIIDKIGKGSFGSIYKGQNVRTKEYVAIKVEPIKNNLKLLKNESTIYQYLNDVKCVPNVKWFGKDNVNYYMVTDLLGNSLYDLIDVKGSFSLTLTLKIGIKLVYILKKIHDKGLVHRDIKPNNFLFGLNQINALYLIDFGFSKCYIQNGIHNKFKTNSRIIGSKNYASISSHKCWELSRRDDLESLSYLLFFLYLGSLPWNNEMDEIKIVKMKEEIINNSNIPQSLTCFLKYSRELTYEEAPDYSYLIDCFMKEIKSLS